MSDYTLIGDLVVLETNLPIVDPREGLFWKQVYVGPQELLYNQRTLLNIQPDERVTISRRGGATYEMEIITPDYRDGQSSTQNKYDLITHEVERSIADHPKAIEASAGAMEAIRSLVRDKVKIEDITFLDDNAPIIYAKLLLGSGSAKFLGFERTFKYSIVTSFRFGTLASEFGVGKLWTAAQIITPSFSGIAFPAGTRFSLAVIDADRDSVANGQLVSVGKTKYVAAPGRVPNPLPEVYKWRWFKLGAHVENLPSGKVQITQEWMGDLWSTWEYDLVT